MESSFVSATTSSRFAKANAIDVDMPDLFGTAAMEIKPVRTEAAADDDFDF